MKKINNINQAVILAGGLGTRLKPLTDQTPKPMIKICGKPFLEYLIEILRNNNIKDIVILTGYLHDKIENYFGNGKKFGVRIKYSYSPVEADTGTRIRNSGKILNDFFLLLYGDNYWPLDIHKYLTAYNKSNKEAGIVIYDNHDKYTKNNVYVGNKNTVLDYDRTRRSQRLNGVDIGFFILTKDLVNLLPDTNCSFEDITIPYLVKKRQLFAYVTSDKYYGLSNLDRKQQIEKAFKSKKVIFLDRDGVINIKPPKASYITKWADFRFIPNSLKALKILTSKGFEFYIITNQPGVARGLMSKNDLFVIHKNMLKSLKNNGITINKIYTCMHGWDDGCICRKPKPGLILDAARENDIDVSETIYIGDDPRDVLTGKNAGTKTALIRNRSTGRIENNIQPDILATSLLDVAHEL